MHVLHSRISVIESIEQAPRAALQFAIAISPGQGLSLFDAQLSELRERVRWAMELVGMDFLAHKDRLTWTLSGGEQRKVALAGVLALQPRILILDEPTAGLDPAAREDLLRYLAGLRETGMALVVATHNMSDIAELTDRVYVLHEGQVALHGETTRILSQARALRELGLDAPPAARISAALRQRGLNLGDALTLAALEASVVVWLESGQRGRG